LSAALSNADAAVCPGCIQNDTGGPVEVPNGKSLHVGHHVGVAGEVNPRRAAEDEIKDPGRQSLPLFRLGTSGWQVVFDEKMFGIVQKKIANAPVEAPKN